MFPWLQLPEALMVLSDAHETNYVHFLVSGESFHQPLNFLLEDISNQMPTDIENQSFKNSGHQDFVPFR